VATHATVDLIKEKFQPFTKLFWVDYNQDENEVGEKMFVFILRFMFV